MTHKDIFHDRLNALRAELAGQGLDGFFVPHADQYQGEYMPEGAERLAWLTGFTGSAGAAVVMADKAVVMSDGRYTIQLRQQVDGDLYELADSTKTPPSAWLKDNVQDGQVIGFDPWLHTPKNIERLEKALAGKSVTLRSVADNPVDAIWNDQPGPPETDVSIFPEEIAGLSVQDKIDNIAGDIREQGAFAAVLTMTDSVAWLLNIRAQDVPHIPLALSYAVIRADGTVNWFIASSRVSPEVQTYLGNRVSTHDPNDLEGSIEVLAKEAAEAGQPVMLDGQRSAVWFQDRLKRGGAEILDQKDPCVLPRACKTPAEQDAMKKAHVRDGVAVTQFLQWLEMKASQGGQTELSAEEKLESFRRMAPEWRDSSFDTIAGFGPNGAIVHYRATEETNLPIEPDGLLLVDSGAQYIDGTTDITRTVAIGTPTEEMKRHFTLVLKGHIALARARFPKGTTGAQLDTLARLPLWQEGLNYAHGTGHGVGCYLSVHEEAASISPKGQEALLPGMILSNEPGYYKEGEYGIRIENLVLVVEDGHCAETDTPMLAFETITLAPMDLRLIVPEMLSAEEKDWLNAYHARVRETLESTLDNETQNWFKSSVPAI